MSSKTAMQVALKANEGVKVNDKMIGLILMEKDSIINLSSESAEKSRGNIGDIWKELTCLKIHRDI